MSEANRPAPDPPGVEAVLRLHRELEKESDRGAVLVAAAMVEEGLLELLRTYLAPNPSSSDSLFDGPNAPLHSFAAKIDVAYRVGLISDRFTRDVHIIRRIRNDFAHRAGTCTLDDQGVRDRIAELSRSHGILERSPEYVRKQGSLTAKDEFIEASSWMIYYLHAHRTRCRPVGSRHPEFGYKFSYDYPPPKDDAT